MMAATDAIRAKPPTKRGLLTAAPESPAPSLALQRAAKAQRRGLIRWRLLDLVRECRQLRHRKHRPIHTNIFEPHITLPADPYATLHSLSQDSVGLLVGEAQLAEAHEGEADHDGRAAEHGDGVGGTGFICSRMPGPGPPRTASRRTPCRW